MVSILLLPKHLGKHIIIIVGPSITFNGKNDFRKTVFIKLLLQHFTKSPGYQFRWIAKSTAAEGAEYNRGNLMFHGHTAYFPDP